MFLPQRSRFARTAERFTVAVAVSVSLDEDHFRGTQSIEDDVTRTTGKDLAGWRQEWLRSLATQPQ
jgi:hypothetical protein